MQASVPVPHGAKQLILNRQHTYSVNISRLREYFERLERELGLGRRDCNVCLVDDVEMRRLNSLYRKKQRATDVLSFPWKAQRRVRRSRQRSGRVRRAHSRSRSGRGAVSEFENFLGDIAISIDTARRNARREGHSTLNEVRWLILHGLLHLLGYDHESDQGEMLRLELALRRRLGI